MKVSATIRRLVFQRAFFLCEYCLLHESNSYLPHQIEHIISQKHKGDHNPENLACACFFCNRLKGTDLSTVLLPDLEVVRLFRPRTDRWLEHFDLSGSLILPKTKIGEATVKVLQLNEVERVEEREAIIEKGGFPHPNVLLFWKSQTTIP